MTDRNRRQVRFSRFSTVSFIDPGTESDAQVKWYSRPELRRLRSMVAAEVQRMRQVITTVHAESSNTQDVLYHCIGIENLLLDESIRQSLERRRRHVNAIRMEQDRQEACQIRDDEVLSMVSKVYTQSSQERSHRLAVEYLNIKEN